MAGDRAWLEPRFQMHYADDQHTDIRFALGAVLGYIDVSIVSAYSVSEEEAKRYAKISA